MNASGQLPLFVYGTLMVPEVMEAVLRRVPLGERALLHGYCRRTLQGEVYPAVFPEPASCVSGLVYFDIAPQERGLLDEYEGDAYCAQSAIVRTDSLVSSVWVYVIRESHRRLLGQASWELETFVRRDLAEYLRQLKGS